MTRDRRRHPVSPLSGGGTGRLPLRSLPSRDRPVDIGFIGLGGMGRAMAANLIKAGHRVRVWNRSRGPVDELARQGAHGVATAREAFRGDAVISMLPTDDVVRSVIVAGGLLDDASPDLVHVNMATISVGPRAGAGRPARRSWDPLCRGAGVRSPGCGRGRQAAGRGRGRPVAIARVQPLLDAIGQKTWPVGAEPHRANVIKLAW